MGDRFAVQHVEQGRDMVFVQRTRVDDRDIAVADDIGSRAHIGERSRVVRDDPPDQRANLLNLAVFEFDVFDEGDGHRH